MDELLIRLIRQFLLEEPAEELCALPIGSKLCASVDYTPLCLVPVQAYVLMLQIGEYEVVAALHRLFSTFLQVRPLGLEHLGHVLDEGAVLREELLQNSLSRERREQRSRRAQVVEHVGREDHLLVSRVVLLHASYALLSHHLLHYRFLYSIFLLNSAEAKMATLVPLFLEFLLPLALETLLARYL